MSGRAYWKLLEARSAPAGSGGSTAQAAAGEPADSAASSDRTNEADELEAAPPVDERPLPKQVNPSELLVVEEDDSQGKIPTKRRKFSKMTRRTRRETIRVRP